MENQLHSLKHNEHDDQEVLLFQYGTKYRVKYTKVSNDINDSRLLEHNEQSFSHFIDALDLYNTYRAMMWG